MLKRWMLALLALPIAAGVSAGPEPKPSPSPSSAVVATIGDKAVTDAELDELAKTRLTRLKNEEYQIKRQVLEDYILRTLMEKEARARGISVEQLQKLEIDERIVPVTEEQQRAAYESSPPEQFQGKTQAEAFAQIEANLTRIRSAEARAKLLGMLRSKTPVTVLMRQPRFAIEAGGGASTGPAGAAVTIVEFSDFQCPACGHAFPTVKRLMEKYQGKVRIVFRDYPLPIHPQAPKAAEAARCAADQGRFWELHDRMFQNQQKLAVADLKAAAAEIGMDGAAFGSCLDSGRYAAAVQKDVADGRGYGVSATPTFFINGRMINGAAPLQSFSQVIDEELQKDAAATTARH